MKGKTFIASGALTGDNWDPDRVPFQPSQTFAGAKSGSR